MDLPQPRKDVFALGQVQGGDDLVLLQPLVDAKLIADVAALEHEELFVELLLELALPLKRQIGGTHDQDALDQASKLELADQQAGHDGLARTRVVGEQEPHAGELEEMLVNGFKLVRQRVNARDREP